MWAKRMAPNRTNLRFFSETGKVKSRIDFLFCSKILKCGGFSTFDAHFTDHKGIQAKFLMECGVHFGRGVWKLNTRLMEEVEIRRDFVLLYDHLFKKNNEFNYLFEWWDWIKYRVKMFFKAWGRRKAEQERKVGVQVENAIPI